MKNSRLSRRHNNIYYMGYTDLPTLPEFPGVSRNGAWFPGLPRNCKEISRNWGNLIDLLFFRKKSKWVSSPMNISTQWVTIWFRLWRSLNIPATPPPHWIASDCGESRRIVEITEKTQEIQQAQLGSSGYKHGCMGKSALVTSRPYNRGKSIAVRPTGILIITIWSSAFPSTLSLMSRFQSHHQSTGSEYVAVLDNTSNIHTYFSLLQSVIWTICIWLANTSLIITAVSL